MYKKFIYYIVVVFLAGCSSYSAVMVESQIPSTSKKESHVFTPVPSPMPATTVAIPTYEMVMSMPSSAGTSVVIKPQIKKYKKVIPLTTAPVTTDDVVDQLKLASLVFVLPESSNINNNIRAELNINPSMTASDLKNQVNKDGQTIATQVMISKVISAYIKAPDFDVVALTAERQAISDSINTQWLWDLRPKAAGSFPVHVTVTAYVTVENNEVERHIKTFDQTMIIVVTPQQYVVSWLSKYWQWIISTLVLPLALWGWRKYNTA